MTPTGRAVAGAARAAFALLTAWPLKAAGSGDPRAAGQTGLPGAAVAFFPWVGLAVGTLQAVAFQAGAWLAGPWAGALAAVGAGVGATGGLHWDGWLDCCDALLGAHPRQRRLDILRDTHTGAFAVIGGAWVLLAQVTALAQLQRPLPALVVAGVASRWAMAAAVALFPAARPQGLGAWARSFAGGRHLVAATGFAAALVLWLGQAQGLSAWVATAAVGAVLAAWARRLLGGLTGDVYGAIQVLAETAALWAWVGWQARGGPEAWP